MCDGTRGDHWSPRSVSVGGCGSAHPSRLAAAGMPHSTRIGPRTQGARPFRRRNRTSISEHGFPVTRFPATDEDQGDNDDDDGDPPWPRPPPPCVVDGDPVTPRATEYPRHLVPEGLPRVPPERGAFQLAGRASQRFSIGARIGVRTVGRYCACRRRTVGYDRNAFTNPYCRCRSTMWWYATAPQRERPSGGATRTGGLFRGAEYGGGTRLVRLSNAERGRLGEFFPGWNG